MLRVLVVDDEALVRRGIVLGINWAELECVVVGEAGNGEEGVELALRLDPGLIITDIRMPRMDGIKTLETIRSHGEWKDIPVIFLTASADRHTVVKASQLKVDDYIKKPFTPADLVERVNKVLATKMLDSPDIAKLFADLENLGK